MPRRLLLTKEERFARLQEQRRRYQIKHKERLNKQCREWYRNNRETSKLAAINRVRYLFPEGADISYRLAINTYVSHRKGSLIVRADRLQYLMEDLLLPPLPNATYKWETDSELNKSHIVATHRLTYSDGKIEWEVVTGGQIGVRRQKLHLILGPDSKIVANCTSSPAIESDPTLLPNYFIRLVLASVGLPI